MSELGIVYFVGAGPGDPGLITIKGLDAIRKADVIIHDRLIHQDLLLEAKQGAEVIDVGKQPGKSHQIQNWINALLVVKAKGNKIVCRLKGGDPFVFGRGGEEIQALVRSSIAFEVIPGVSCLNAVPAAAGIPLTHRDFAHAFMVTAGCHASQDTEDWSIAAKFVSTGGTLVVLMGLSRILSITGALCKHGCPPSVPAAVVSSGTLANQDARIGTVGDIAGKVSDLQSPAVIVIGSVVNARELAANNVDDAERRAFTGFAAHPSASSVAEKIPSHDSRGSR